MITGQLANALKGIGGEFEISRVVGFISGISYSVGALGFTAWNMAEGREFDVVGFCAAFAGGAAIITGGTAGAAAWKDKGVASAKVIEATGSKPATPPAPAPTAQPELASASGDGSAAEAPTASDAGLPESLR